MAERQIRKFDDGECDVRTLGDLRRLVASLGEHPDHQQITLSTECGYSIFREVQSIEHRADGSLWINWE